MRIRLALLALLISMAQPVHAQDVMLGGEGAGGGDTSQQNSDSDSGFLFLPPDEPDQSMGLVTPPQGKAAVPKAATRPPLNATDLRARQAAAQTPGLQRDPFGMRKAYDDLLRQQEGLRDRISVGCDLRTIQVLVMPFGFFGNKAAVDNFGKSGAASVAAVLKDYCSSADQRDRLGTNVNLIQIANLPGAKGPTITGATGMLVYSDDFGKPKKADINAVMTKLDKALTDAAKGRDPNLPKVDVDSMQRALDEAQKIAADAKPAISPEYILQNLGIPRGAPKK